MIIYFSRANPTTTIYNASAVKIYNATSSQVRLTEKKFSTLKKRST
jgi:hypothetical protein